MSKATPTIHSAVQHKGRTFIPGMEAELATALLPKQIEYLTGQGVISGFTISATVSPAPAEDPANKAPKEPESDPKPAPKGKKAANK